MLKEIFKENIMIYDKIDSWEDSIKLASKPLIDKKFIEPNYVNAMIDSIKKLGFYVVLSDGVAMPHARPEDGVNKTTMSLLKLNTPVLYGEKEIFLIFILAAETNDSHVELLSAFADMISDDEELVLLKNSKNIEALYQIINKY